MGVHVGGMDRGKGWCPDPRLQTHERANRPDLAAGLGKGGGTPPRLGARDSRGPDGMAAEGLRLARTRRGNPPGFLFCFNYY